MHIYSNCVIVYMASTSNTKKTVTIFKYTLKHLACTSFVSFQTNKHWFTVMFAIAKIIHIYSGKQKADETNPLEANWSLTKLLIPHANNNGFDDIAIGGNRTLSYEINGFKRVRSTIPRIAINLILKCVLREIKKRSKIIIDRKHIRS